MVRHGSVLHIRFLAQEPTPLAKKDALLVTLKKGAKELTLTANAERATARSGGRELTSAILVGSEHNEGWWRVEVKLPLVDLGFEPGRPETLAAQLQRHRALRGNTDAKEKGTDYYWMPPMKPSWGEQFRFGQLHFNR
jgi:hypothetical protein